MTALAAAALPRLAAASPDPWARIDPVLRDRLSRGLNLSHWFWTPVGGRRSGDPDYLPDAELAEIAALGFGHVRLAVDAEQLYGGGAQRATVERLRKALDRIVGAGLLAVVAPFGVANRWSPERRGSNADAIERLAAEVAGYGPRHLVFAVVNEPLLVTPQDWSPIQEDLVVRARRLLPEHLLIGSAPLRPAPADGAWGAHHALMQVTPPADPNLALALHWYEPFWLTHAGADWLGAEELAVLEANAGRRYRDSDWQQGRLEAELRLVADWSRAAAVPVYIAEFGAFRYGGAPAVDRESWAADCVDLFARFALPWCWWDYAEGFGLATGQAGARSVDPALARALLRSRS